jgi:hypothetical protein
MGASKHGTFYNNQLQQNDEKRELRPHETVQVEALHVEEKETELQELP